MTAKKVSRRTFLKVTGLSLGGAALAACAAPAPAAAPAAAAPEATAAPAATEAPAPTAVPAAAEAPAAAAEEGVLWGLEYDPHVATYKRLAGMFKEKSGVTLAVEPQAWPIETKLIAGLAAGVAPNVVCIMGKMCIPLHIQKALMPLKEAVYAANGVNPETDFVGDGIGAYSWEGDIYGVPTEVNGVGNIVNVPVDDVKALGLEKQYPPTNGEPFFESFESMWDLAKALQVEKDGKVERWGLSSKGWDNQSYLGILRTLLKPEGVDWWDNNNKKFNINTEAGIKAMEFHAEMPVKLGIETELDQNQIDAAMAGKVALARGNGGPSVQGRALGYNYYGCGNPKIGGQVAQICGEAGWGFVAPAENPSTDVAVKFLQMMATEEGQMGYSKIYDGIISCWAGLAGNFSYFTDPSDDNPNVQLAKIVQEHLLPNTQFYGEGFGYPGEVDGAGGEITSLVRQGKLTAAEACVQYQERAEAQYKQFLEDLEA